MRYINYVNIIYNQAVYITELHGSGGPWVQSDYCIVFYHHIHHGWDSKERWMEMAIEAFNTGQFPLKTACAKALRKTGKNLNQEDIKCRKAV